MTTIEKKVHIPENRRLLLELTLPADLPPGEAEIKVTITPTTPRQQQRKPFERLAGCLKDSETFDSDPLQIQQEMRNEW